jgi:hypothetical protein
MPNETANTPNQGGDNGATTIPESTITVQTANGATTIPESTTMTTQTDPATLRASAGS